ncbi:MAG: glycosyltransferase family 2 protein [Methylophilaceae bacterium]|nr:MAG: glycosyltransferase family 2 protein [Methylophilaceae bacterium]
MPNIQAPVISIIIPAYNYAHTLERAIISAHKQLDENCELIIINDGSTDKTADLLASLTLKYNNILVINKQNGGLASTRNEGIRLAKGDYLIFLDADDELHTDAIYNIRLHLKQNPESRFVIGGHVSINQNSKKKMHLPNQLPESSYDKLKAYLIDKTISISNGACVMHNSIFTNYVYPEHFRNSEDLAMFAYTLVNFNCSTLSFPLANIHKHDDSLRHNVEYSESVGLHLVEEVFNINRIPKALQSLKKPFLVQRLLSLSRVSHESNRHLQNNIFFVQAFKLDKSIILRWPYFKKFIISFYKHHQTKAIY